MSRPITKEQERALQERANRCMHDLEKTYVFLRTDSHKGNRRSDDSKRDLAAMEALSEIREKLSA